MVALRKRSLEGGSYHVRLSLVQTGQWVWNFGKINEDSFYSPISKKEIENVTETMPSFWGELQYIKPVVQLSDTAPRFKRSSVPLGADSPDWNFD